MGKRESRAFFLYCPDNLTINPFECLGFGSESKAHRSPEKQERNPSVFKIVWDAESNGVRLTMSSAGEALRVSPRPVFWEELDLLGLNTLGWIYPHVEAPLLWACDRRYYYCGQLVLEVKGGNIFDAPTVVQQPGYESLTLQPVDMQRLRERNEDTMFIIEHEAMDFINQTYRRYKNLRRAAEKNPDLNFQQLADNMGKRTKQEHVVVKEDCDSFDVMPLSRAEQLGKAPILNSNIEMFIASFSGGKDSQVMLDLVTRVVPNEEIYVIYSNTGYELPTSITLYKETEEFYKEHFPLLRFVTAANHQNVLYYWDEMDSPSRIHRWCCAVMKTAPIYRLLKQIYGTGKQPKVMAFEGVRAEESERRSQYARIGRGVKHSNVINVRPIFEWSATEVWLYLMFHKLPINEAYRKGLNRVGCVVCPLSSELGDCLDNRIFPNTAKPFIDKLKEKAQKEGIKNVDDYIKYRKWKVRAGGNRHISTSSVVFKQTNPDFTAEISHPKEDFFEWIKTLGTFSINQTEDNYIGNIKYNKAIYQFLITHNQEEDLLTIHVQNCGHDIAFIGHLKRVLHKVTYCVHCEVCEVECPTGALSVVPIVKIDETKCVHCRKCLDFIDNGCETANSIKKTIGITTNENMNGTRSTINRFNTFGLRERWLEYYFAHLHEYFSSTDHGLNVKKQLPVFKKWLVDADILEVGKETATTIGNKLANVYQENKEKCWEVIWVSLCDNTDLFAWFIANCSFAYPYKRDDLDNMLADAFPAYTAAVRENTLKAFVNTFKESPLGNAIPVGLISKESGKPVITRHPHTGLSLVAVAYSLYRYAERQKRRLLTVSEFYDDNQREGIHRQFGIDKDTLGRLLLSVQEESNHVLRAELNMGLDNIILRDDLTSTDIIKLML